MAQPRSGGRRHKRRHRAQTSHGPQREHLSELAPVVDPPAIESFEEWDLGEDIQRAIRNMEIVRPTPIQSLSIGAVLEGRDVIAKAETGTGKTLAFGAPMMARMDPARATVLGLVLCPTRELAQQVATVLEALALPRGLRVALVVGGDPMHPQITALQAGAQVVVGTPGRVLDLFQQRFLQFPWTECVVLDEADKMFEIGFLDDVRKILSFLPDERQTLLFSATFPTEVLKLARAETKEPLEVATQKGTVAATSIEQSWIAVEDEDRPLVLTRFFEQSRPDDVFLVFCERRTEVDRLLRRLERLPFAVKALHGGYDQASRFRVMSAFREGGVKALLATDVASRGLDVELVTHVVNYSVPRELEDYAHRIGRTGRAGRTGTAITLVPRSQQKRWRAIQAKARWEIREEEPPRSTRGRRDEPRRGARDEPRRGARDERPERERPERERPERERPERERPERERPERERPERERPERERPERERTGRERSGRGRDGEAEARARRSGRPEEPDERAAARPPRRRRSGEEPAREEAPRSRDEGRRDDARPARARQERQDEERPRQRERASDDSGRGEGASRARGKERPARGRERGREDGARERRPERRAPAREPEAAFGALPEEEPAAARPARRGGRERRPPPKDSSFGAGL